MRLIAVLAVTLLSAEAYASGEVILGGGLVYGSDIARPGLQLGGYYAFDRNSKLANLRLGLDLDVFLSNSDDFEGGTTTVSWMDLDVNGQYVFLAPKDQPFLVYGLAGLNFARVGVNVDYNEMLSARDIDNHDLRVGVNLGAGAEYAVDVGEKNGADFSLYAEGKYVISEANQLVFAAGARFALPL